MKKRIYGKTKLRLFKKKRKPNTNGRIYRKWTTADFDTQPSYGWGRMMEKRLQTLLSRPDVSMGCKVSVPKCNVCTPSDDMLKYGNFEPMMAMDQDGNIKFHGVSLVQRPIRGTQADVVMIDDMAFVGPNANGRVYTKDIGAYDPHWMQKLYDERFMEICKKHIDEIKEQPDVSMGCKVVKDECIVCNDPGAYSIAGSSKLPPGVEIGSEWVHGKDGKMQLMSTSFVLAPTKKEKDDD